MATRRSKPTDPGLNRIEKRAREKAGPMLSRLLFPLCQSDSLAFRQVWKVVVVWGPAMSASSRVN
jgi:hypothetical protein